MPRLEEIPSPAREELLKLAERDAMIRAGLEFFQQGTDPLQLLLSLVIGMGQRHAELMQALNKQLPEEQRGKV